MKLIKFPESHVEIAKDQPGYDLMPAYHYEGEAECRIVCCWQLTWTERLWLLCTGKVWHQILTFGLPVQPQYLTLAKPLMLPHAAPPVETPAEAQPPQ